MKIKELEKILPGRVYYFPEIDSTSSCLRRKLLEGMVPQGSLVLSDMQTAGRGRKDRFWYSPPGGLYFSLYLQARGEWAWSAFSLVTAGAVIKGLKEHFDLSFCVKWPNDIMLEKKKLAGILCEKYGQDMILGLGLNLWSQPENEVTDAISLKEVLDFAPGRTSLLLSIIRNLLQDYQIFLQEGFSFFHKKLERLSYLKGKAVHISGEKKKGKVLGYTGEGALLLELIDGQKMSFYSGTVRVIEGG